LSVTNRLLAELKGDRTIWMIVILLSLFSMLIVYSSTGKIAYVEREGDTAYFLFSQFAIICVGWFAMYICYKMHYSRFSKIAPYLLAVAIPLLAFTLVFGVNINDAKRWIRLFGITFQTSDFAKIVLVMYVARAIASKQDRIKEFREAFVPIILPIVIVCGLIAPADLSTAIILFATCFAMMFVGRIEIKYLVALVMAGVTAFAMICLVGLYTNLVPRVHTWIERVRAFMSNEDEGYQIMQAKIAIARGEFLGIGPGHSLQRNYLPSPYSDYIYSMICEEYGLFGAFLILALYILLLVRVTRLVTNSSKAFGAMLAMGMCLLIVIQAVTNMSVSVNLIPVAGLTLPLISRGGTSFLFMSIAFGMILSVSKQQEKEQFETLDD
jgi:cell division protein FtsW